MKLMLLLALVAQDLSAFDAVGPEVDLSAFDSQPTIISLAAFEPNPLAEIAIDLSVFDRPADEPKSFKQISVDYPTRRTNWSWPGGTQRSLIDHLCDDPAHYGRFNRQELAMLSLDELKSLHSDDHEGKRKPIQTSVVDRIHKPGIKKIEVPKAKGRVDRSPLDGRIRYEHSDGVWRESPQDGVDYEPEPVPVMQSQSANCPRGVCPAPRGRVFRWVGM